MSSIYSKRFDKDPKQTQLTHHFTGQAHILQLCLDYKGTQGQLTCTIDGNNVKIAAQKAAVRDIITAYDTGATQHFPDINTFKSLFKKMVQSCKPGDIMFVQYSGHGLTVENQDGLEQEDQAFNFRNRKGQDQFFPDGQAAEMISTTLPDWLPCVFFVDACHSGSILDLQKSDVYKGKKVILLSGCQDNQYSQDTGNGGVMTHALLSVLASPECIQKRKKRCCSLQYIFNKMVDKNTNNPLPPNKTKNNNAHNNAMQEQEQQMYNQQLQQDIDYEEYGLQYDYNNPIDLDYHDGQYYHGDQVVNFFGYQFNEFQQFWNQDEFNFQYSQDVQFYSEEDVIYEPIHEEKPSTDAQYFNLSWTQAADPTTICFPF